MVASEAVFELPSRARWTLLTAVLTISCFYNAKAAADDKNWGLFALQIVGGVIGITLVPRIGGAQIVESLPGGVTISSILSGAEGLGVLECLSMLMLGLLALFGIDLPHAPHRGVGCPRGSCHARTLDPSGSCEVPRCAKTQKARSKQSPGGGG